MTGGHEEEPGHAGPAAAPWLSIIGLGESGVEGISPGARVLLEQAELVVGGQRHLDMAVASIHGRTMAWASPLEASVAEILAWRGRPVVVLASGDPFFHGVGTTLRRHVQASEMLCLPAVSCVALAASRLHWPQQHCPVISLTTQPLESLRPALQPGRRLFVLSADAESPRRICTSLIEWGFGDTRVWIMEALGGPAERIREGRAREFDLTDVARLNLLALDVVAEPGARVWPVTAGLPDEWFEHDGQITKREVRAVTLASLAPRAGELLWDLGCGSGSVSIEWLLAHPANRAIAVELRADRAARAARNAAVHGVPHLQIRQAAVRDALDDLPAPDAIFIGGGAREAGIIDRCWDALLPGGRMVINSVVIETEMRVHEAWQRLGGSLTRISIERLDAVGGVHGFRPAMPVLQWVVHKPETRS